MLGKLSADDHYSDKVIWNSFRNGDKEAFSTLYYRYFGVLIQNCVRYSDDKYLIEDCVHDLFLEIWGNKMNLATPDSVKAYLLCSTQRKITRQLKKSRNWYNRVCHKSEFEVAQSIEEQMISEQNLRENKREISMALDSLTKRQKEAVILRYYENLSYPEIALKMTISTDSVYNLVSKALDNIQKEMLLNKSKLQTAYSN